MNDSAIKNSDADDGISLYVHLPWCIKKCPYCDFNSHPGSPDYQLQSRYVDALIADLSFELQDPLNGKIRSIFFGGGTPSLFEAALIERLLVATNDAISLSDDCEITLEANPGTIEAKRFAGFRSAGINRISIGVQSFNDKQLKTLGRIHNGNEARQAISVATDAGFTNFNLDLMYGLPGQSPAEAIRDLDAALEFNSPHLSWYQLTLEPNTAFYKHPPQLPKNDALADIQAAGSAHLNEAGFSQYEISAWARGGAVCQHNINYWQFGDYLGIGAGAHAKRRLNNGVTLRRSRLRSPERFMKSAGAASCISEERSVIGDDLIFEYLLNALRLAAGVNLKLFESRTGMGREMLIDRLRQPLEQSLLIHSENHIRCSQRGWEMLDSILANLLP